MSIHDHVDIPHQRYWEFTVFRIKPGHEKEWSDLTKIYTDGYAKTPEAHWATFENQYGSDGGACLVATPMRSLSEVDQEMTDDKQLKDTLGADGMKKLAELETACVESVSSNLFQFAPKMSYPRDEWVKADPGFWKRSAAPAKKEAAKAKQ